MIQLILFYLLLGTSVSAKLFEDTVRVLNTDTTNVCTGITPGNLTTCGGKSCTDNTGTIGNCSCVSTSNSTQTSIACVSNSGTILSVSCNGFGEGRCALNGAYRAKPGYGSGDGYISNYSCNAGQYDTDDVCAFNGVGGPGSGKGFIGHNSCNNAASPCCDSNGFASSGKAEGYIESNSCNDSRGTSGVCQYNGACWGNSTSYGRIGPNSCNKGTDSCNNNGRSFDKEKDSYGIIGAHSCNNGENSSALPKIEFK